MDDAELPTLPRRPTPLAQPLSFGGVAEMGLRPVWSLLVWQWVSAAVAAIALTWALDQTWGRALRQSAGQLPDQAAIRAGRLEWPTAEPAILSQGPFVSLMVDPAGVRNSAMASDVTFFVGPEGGAFGSLFGWFRIPYPPDLNLPLGRREVSANLAAWEGPAHLALVAGIGTALLLAWWVLSLLYGALIRAGAAWLGRAAGFRVAWRTAGAAMLAPAFLMTAAGVLYATRNLTFVGLLLAFPLHLVAGWIYCAGGLAHLPAAVGPDGNPFGEGPGNPKSKVAPAARANPFQPS